MNTKRSFKDVFGTMPLIGVIHLFGATPESERSKTALTDVQSYLSSGIKNILIENFDYGFGKHENIFFELGNIVDAIKGKFGEQVTLGVKTKSPHHDYLLSYKNRGASFVQLDHVTGGLVMSDGNHGTITTFENFDNYVVQRAAYPEVFVLGGVHPDCYKLKDVNDCVHPLLLRSCEMTVEMCDSLVITGGAVRYEVKQNTLSAVRTAVDDFPILIGSGLSDANAKSLLAFADGAIIGSYFREQGVQLGSRISSTRIEKLLAIRESLL